MNSSQGRARTQPQHPPPQASFSPYVLCFPAPLPAFTTSSGSELLSKAGGGQCQVSGADSVKRSCCSRLKSSSASPFLSEASSLSAFTLDFLTLLSHVSLTSFTYHLWFLFSCFCLELFISSPTSPMFSNASLALSPPLRRMPCKHTVFDLSSRLIKLPHSTSSHFCPGILSELLVPFSFLEPFLPHFSPFFSPLDVFFLFCLDPVFSRTSISFSNMLPAPLPFVWEPL